MSPEEFRNIAQGVQALLLALGVLSAGIWALLRLRLFGELSRAKLEARQLERLATERKGITVGIDVTSSTTDGGFVAIAEVTIENPGSTMYHLDLSRRPFRVYRVTEFLENDLDLKEVFGLDVLSATPGGIGRAVGLSLFPSTTKELSFCCRLVDSGLYLFAFTFPTPVSLASYNIDAEEFNSAKIHFKERTGSDLSRERRLISAQRFIHIGAKANERAQQEAKENAASNLGQASD